MQKYPLGIQDFSRLREDGCVYVDKTEHIYKLLQGVCYFLSHPRRFGKSLLLTTLKYLFEGRKDLFAGLWIEDKIEWERFPVLHFSFIESGFHTIGFAKYLHIKIDDKAQEFGITLQQTDLSNKMRELITKVHEKFGKQVVLLVDEYDKPITEFLRKDNISIAEENRDLMKQFYSPIKELDKYLRFVFITGVSKFSKVSIFSDLNHLEDITLMPDFATLLGYTEEEITAYFSPRIQQIADYQELTYQECFAKMRLWYNGYSWNKGKDKVYNPTSVLKFLKNKEFENYWFETGTPTFLIQMLREKFIYAVEEIEVSDKRLGSFQLDNIDEITLLFQTGYLTIKDRDNDIYTLCYPNKEVRDSMNNYLLAEYTYQQDLIPTARNIFLCLGKRDFEQLFHLLNGMLGEIPHQIFDAKQEKYYHAIIFLTFKLLGYYAQTEISTHLGRIDVVVETKDGIFIFEFKVNGTLEEAMAQIHTNKYYQRYEGTSKEIYLIAVVCKDKTISTYNFEQYK